MEPLPDLATLSDEDLKKLIDELTREEQEVSYRRRLLHGKIDILRAELVARLQKTEGRSVLDSVDVDSLTEILTGKAAPPCLMAHVYCPECGYNNPEAAHFCAKCGAALVVPEEGESTEAFAAPELPESPRPARAISASTAPALVVRSGGGRAGRDVRRWRTARTTIGRSPECAIFLDDVTVSRKHAVFTQDGDRWQHRGPGQPQRDVRQPRARRVGRAQRRRRDPDRQVPADLPPPADGDDRSPLAPPAPDDRHRLQPAQGRVPGHLDLEDPLPRGPGAPDAAADAGRLPALRRGRRRAAGDDPAPAARRVPAAARDPRGARRRRRQAAAPAPQRGRRGGGGARPRRRSASAPASTADARARARGVRTARAARRGRAADLHRERRRDRRRVRGARALRDRTAAPARLPHGRRPRERACSRR